MNKIEYFDVWYGVALYPPGPRLAFRRMGKTRIRRKNEEGPPAELGPGEFQSCLLTFVLSFWQDRKVFLVQYTHIRFFVFAGWERPGSVARTRKGHQQNWGQVRIMANSPGPRSAGGPWVFLRWILLFRILGKYKTNVSVL